MINVVRMLTIDEGYTPHRYKDTAGKTTIGIGFNMDSPNAKDIWSEAEIEEDFDRVYNGLSEITKDESWALLNVCVTNCEKDLVSVFHDYASFPENIKLALINLMFNLGAPKFRTFLTFIGRIRIQNYIGAAEDLMTTLWAKQLPMRAIRVKALLEGTDNPYTNVNE